MDMIFCPLYSGSSGNALFVQYGGTRLLIDAGKSGKMITEALDMIGVDPATLDAMLITHEHSDHISGLPVLCKQMGADIYTTEATARQICYRTAGLEQRFCVFDPGDRFAIGTLTVESFATSHDCACPVGYTVTDGTRRLALCTDTGKITRPMTEAIGGAHTLIGEFNYDPDMLRAGPYPAYLKERILSDHGHLSNETGGKLAVWAAKQGANRIILAHLSKENNLPAVALTAAKNALNDNGISGVELLAAPRDNRSDWMEV